MLPRLFRRSSRLKLSKRVLPDVPADSLVELARIHHFGSAKDAPILQGLQTLHVRWYGKEEHHGKAYSRLDRAQKEQAWNALTLEEGEA